VSELGDRFERLAGRGSPRGADAVLNDAMRDVPTNEVKALPDDVDDFGDLPIIGGDVPMVTTEAAPRSRARTLIAVFGVAALVGVAGLAIASVFGNGGAGSPEGAVRQLADAVSHKDPLAAIDVLSPTEVRSMRDTVKGATNRAADLKIVNDASAPLAGVDLSVDHLQLSTEQLAPGYTKVIVTGGELSADAHTAQLSKLLQDATRNANPSDTKTTVNLAKLARDEDLPTFVVTVRREGRWYVSPAYTALEYSREIGDGPAADFGSAQSAANLGADTPELAVSDALHAWQASDWNRLMALAPPDELPVYDYRAWLGQVASKSEPNFTIDKLTTTASVNGDNATVKLDASGSMGSGDNRGTWQVGGSCHAFSASQSFDASGSDVFSTGGGERPPSGVEWCLSGDLGNVIPFGLIPLSTGSEQVSSTGPVSIQVVRENGRWFVSPVSTVLKALDATVQHLDERSIYTLLNLAYELPPDATITLDQPFTPPTVGGPLAQSVLAFDGTGGQKVIGEISGTNGFASGELFTADGKEVDYVEFSPRTGGFAYPVELPATGSYRLVLEGSVPKGDTLTLWDAKHAPKGLTESPGSGVTSGVLGVGNDCTTSGNVTSCSTSSSGATQSYPVGPLNSSSSGAAEGSSANSATATSSPSPSPTVPVGAPTSVP
jgi:hypothetical protein